MSYDFNYKFWVATKKDLDDVIKQQDVLKTLIVEDREVNHDIFADLFATYTDLVNKLSFIYHNTFQVQKREVIKGLLEASSNRLIELKTELKKIELSEFTYIDRTLVQRKLLPTDISILRPIYFPYWRSAHIQSVISGPRIEIPKELLEGEEEEVPKESDEVPEETPAPEGEDENEKRMTRRSKSIKARPPPQHVRPVIEVAPISPRKLALTNAVITIQRHDRARQARRLLTFIRLHPDEYQPRLVFDEGRYKWTHKPDQSMLIPVKRTKFEANYYLNRKDFTNFRFYISPAHRKRPEEGPRSKSPIEEIEIVETEESNSEEDDESIDELIEEDDNADKKMNVEAQELLIYYLNTAAIIIQFAWKRYKRRRRLKAEKLHKEVVLGMVQVRFSFSNI